MKKIRKLYFRAARESLENSRMWLEESIHFLYERKSYGHSLSLSIFALEEAVKGWMCFSVALGSSNPSDPEVKEVFESHLSKLESALMWWFILNAPLLQKSLSESISEDEQEKILEWLSAVDEYYINSVKRLVNLRLKGLYVDVVEGKISSPYDISKEETEGILYDVQTFVRLFEKVIKQYDESSLKEKALWVERAKTISKLAVENWETIHSKAG